MFVVDQAASGRVSKNLNLPVYEVLVAGFLRSFLSSRRRWFSGGLAEGIPTKQVPFMLFQIVFMYLVVLYQLFRRLVTC